MQISHFTQVCLKESLGRGKVHQGICSNRHTLWMDPFSATFFPGISSLHPDIYRRRRSPKSATFPITDVREKREREGGRARLLNSIQGTFLPEISGSRRSLIRRRPQVSARFTFSSIASLTHFLWIEFEAHSETGRFEREFGQGGI